MGFLLQFPFSFLSLLFQLPTAPKLTNSGVTSFNPKFRLASSVASLAGQKFGARDYAIAS